ncbi:MAG: electron transport complex subunit E [Oscillospiraceae bacterium]|nr:electron transport complex subunit E [Oscillospiraceae bacterium]
MNLTKEFIKGIIKENPVLVMLLGTCPTLAVTAIASNGLGMGLATTFVLLGSSVVISLLKKVIPGQVRLPAYIIIIAGFVTLVSFLLQVYVPDLYDALGVFLSLITVNCIILGRAEAFASKNSVAASAADALGMGVGFTLALVAIGSLREILGSLTWFGIDLSFGVLEPIGLFTMPAGGFMIYGFMIAVVNRISNYQISKKKMGCENCPSRSACSGKECAEK